VGVTSWSVAREAEKTGQSVKEILLAKGLLTPPQEIKETLSPLRLTEPGR